ncbi:hypothetical protein BASA50_010163 [Batrachochytrium salamandrivorans]|uniref:PAN2-PAN3 deadenylation complex catalytic subunit PAN2 n=1 Tax=Batrachochytrium salamandrivorans TaxID=1357716 RepID=A0ABQ8EZB6_9FUNG|nr:hypothetical protein BASA62_006904 [Batrachochytrium salamandrivorans]KAH6577034.1 hypothetical protein BASA60_004270 [Batrachochytrium salamandrivorans]KAH6580326.1 hypothetical protein BASA61_009699 [Batrachochytrium salamandrivorans]KAH6589288.1 hypothetical protein BASA50_010163 [Batrachochytrium salamandrivorans]KAH9258807.1 hypothetical protein BASA81_002871 [Batrachochytrium salamandrivorans]
MFAVPWEECQRLHVLISARSTPGLSAVAFDQFEDLLWTGTRSGQVTSFINTRDALPRYTSYPAHNDCAVSQLMVHDNGVVSLSSKNVRLTSRCGVQLWNKLMPDAKCMSFTNTSSQLHVISSLTTLAVINLFRGNIVKEIPLEEPIVAMRRGQMMVHATASGQVQFRDPNTMQVQHTISAHAGAIADLDIIGNTMATCGFSTRDGTLLADRLVKLYDIRTMRLLPPISFSSSPEYLRFHPRQPSLLYIMSKTGAIQICDTMSQSYSAVTFLRAEMAGPVSSFDISSNGETFAVGDETNSCSVWSTKAANGFNQYSRPSEYRSMFFATPEAKILDVTPLSAVGMPIYTEELLSAWPNSLLVDIGRQQPRIPPEVLKNVKMCDFVGYVRDMPLKRNQNLIASIRTSALSTSSSPGINEPKFRSQQQRDKLRQLLKSGSHVIKSASTLSGTTTPDGEPLAIAAHNWRKIEIKYSKFGVEDFDFGFYNSTKYGGLETHIQNSYCNSLLQALFFNRPLCELVKAHIRTQCARDLCLACELGFLFRMLEDSKGVNCQASNFLRAFGAIPQAHALGLVEADSSHTDTLNPLALPYGKLIQTTFRFLLEQMHQELGARSSGVLDTDGSLPDEYIKTIYGIPLWMSTKCQDNHVLDREINPFVIDISYDLKNASPDFLELLSSSINRGSSTRAWCDQCQKYQMVTQTRKLNGFPYILSLNSNISNDAESEIWLGEGPGTDFLPKSFALKKDSDGLIVVDFDELPTEVNFNSTDVVIYDLRTVVSSIQFENETPHLVSCINVSEDYEHPKWYLFNDFLVLDLCAGEECQFEEWRIPAVIQYVRRLHPDENGLFMSPIDPDCSILLAHKNINTNPNINFNYELFDESEIPRSPGYICAIDAEFVVMTEAEIEIHSDGSKLIIRPAQSGLARVSVVRGMDPRIEVPFIDDYIFISQPVVNYLTEFSGITAGDLDVRTSRHPIVSLKDAYKKLRLLVDIGCIFIGHGLKKDCRTINIFIPPQQIIDTVDIYHLKQYGRKLSLRFLVWYFFKEDIHLSSHDSVEDARAALRIYQKYLEAKKMGTFDALLSEIYQEGRKYNFRPPNAPIIGIAGAARFGPHARTQSSDY